MKTYIVEDKIINLETKETMTFYTGKDGYIHDEPEYCDGYIRPIYAQNKIKNELEHSCNMEKLDNNHGLEGKRWLHIYQVIEYVVAD